MTNPSFKKCSSGHYFASSLSECPYCNESSTRTVTSSNNTGNDDKTEIVKPSAKASPMNLNGNDQSTINLGNKGPFIATNDDRTMIRVPSKDGEDSHAAGTRNSRKLVGWLVSFTIDEMGVDYRLFEGQNKVGREPSCSVRIIQDGSISTHHATILFRNNALFLRDEMTTNSSFVNGIELLPGATVEIRDGDKIKFGSNDFLVRVAY